MRKTIFLFLFMSVLFSKEISNTLKISYQNIHFKNENLGLMETAYLFNFRHFYTGISIYSAISGKRGGFFVGGFDSGFKYKISNITSEIGLFLGGGGGGHAPQGSGLMLKLYTNLMYKNFGMQYSKIKFKDSPINSNQIGFIYEKNFKDIYLFSPKPVYGKFRLLNIIFRPYILTYYPFSSNDTMGNKEKPFSVIGAEIINQKENYFTFIDAGGAFIGDADGYAEFLIGIGKKYQFGSLKFALGAAGGGEVDTKGGLVYKIGFEKNFKFFNIQTGFFNAPKGIKAFYLQGGINTKFNLITTGNEYLIYKPKKFEISIYNESYLPSSTIRTNKNSKRLDILNIDFGYYLFKNFAFLINAGASYNGNSGGYATGMFGIKGIYKGFFAKIYLGAAGGGSVATTGGITTKANIGYEMKHFFISYGKIKALKGALNTYTIDFGIKFNFYK